MRFRLPRFRLRLRKSSEFRERSERDKRVDHVLSRVVAGELREARRLDQGRGLGEVVESYPIGKSLVAIAVSEGEGRYLVQEPDLTPNEQAVYVYMLDKMYYTFKPDMAERPEETRAKLREIVGREVTRFGASRDCSLDNVLYFLNRDIFGYNVVDIPMTDSRVEDVSCAGPGVPLRVFHRGYGGLGWLRTNISFQSEEELADFIRRLAHLSGKGISTAIPFTDFILPDGSRVAVTLGKEVTTRGSSFTIRKYPEDPLTIPYLVMNHTLSSLMAAYLWFLAESRKMLFIAGPAAAGKTTLLNGLLSLLNPNSKIVTIEDTNELRLPHEQWIQHVSRRSYSLLDTRYEVGIADLLKFSLRERPDYIVVGEVRGEEVGTLVQASAAGHGALTSFHTDSVQAMFTRLTSPPMEVKESFLDLIWAVAFLGFASPTRGERVERRVFRVAETSMVEGNLLDREVFQWDSDSDSFYPKSAVDVWAASDRLKQLASLYNMDRETVLEEISRRERLIERAVHEGAIGFGDFKAALRGFYRQRVKPSRRAGVEAQEAH